MFKKLKKYIIITVDILGVIVLLSSCFAAWKLHNGPVNLDFLNPYIINALTPDNGNLNVDLKTTKLTWGKGIHPIDIKAYKVNISKKNGQILAQIPEISLDFSFKALFNGIISPEVVELIHPYFNIIIEEKDNDTKNTPNQKADINKIIKKISDIYEQNSVEYLNEVRIVNAEITIVDKKNSKSFYLPDVDLFLEKKYNKIRLDAAFTLDRANRNLYTKISSIYDIKNKDLSYKTSFNNLKSIDLVDFIPNITDISSTNLTFKGQFKGTINLEKQNAPNCSIYNISCNAFDRTNFILTTGVGTIKVPSDEQVKYNIYESKISGNISAGIKDFNIDSANINFGGPLVSLTGQIKNIKNFITKEKKENIKANIATHIKRLPFNDLPRYWSSKIGTDAHKWIKESLSEGVFENSNFNINMSFDKSGKIKIDNLKGDSFMSGVTVKYMEKMPIITNVDGIAYFENDKINIDVKKGYSMGMSIKNAKVDLLDLWSDTPHADLHIKVNGKIKDALNIVDSKPLQYAKALEISPNKIKGETETDLYLKFPFEKELGLDKVKVEVVSVLENVKIPQIYNNHSFDKGSLNLILDNQSMNVTGFGYIAKNKSSITWNENFNKKANFKHQYKISTTLNDKSRKKLGIDFAPFTKPYMTGEAKIDLVYKEKQNKEAFLGITTDLSDCDMKLPYFGWKKDKTEAASGVFSAIITNKKLSEISSFRLFSKDLELQGKIDLQNNGKDIKRIRFSKFKIGRTNAKAHITKNKNNLVIIDLSGNVFDLETLADNFFENNNDEISSQTKDMQFKFNVAVDKVWGSKNGYINNVGAILEKNKKGEKKLKLIGNLPISNAPLNFSVIPNKNGGYNISSKTNDAGGMLKAFGILENIKHGNMNLNIQISKDDIWNGKLFIENFRLISAPVFARLLTVASLTGVVDLLSGEGIGFDKLDLPFSYAEKKLKIKNAKATGTSLGITGKGFVSFNKNQNIVMEGVIAPAYLINSLLGKIPLIGDIFGGKDGGGLFAATYEIKGNRKEPKITVNPLTALAPGFLRSIFGGAVEKAEKKEQANKIPKNVNNINKKNDHKIKAINLPPSP